jgi:beta-galactosidase
MFYAHGGDFGEPDGTHGGNFCCDGLIFPDRTPSPALLNVKAIIQPVVFTREGDRLRIRSKYDIIDLAHLSFVWRLEQSGSLLEEGFLRIPHIGPRESATIDFPLHRSDVSRDAARCWWIISAMIEGVSWVDGQHEVAWCQFPYERGRVKEFREESTDRRTHLDPRVTDDVVHVGPCIFSSHSGELSSIGTIKIKSATIDVWRALTDNDKGGEVTAAWPEIQNPNAKKWLEAGLDRVLTRVDSVELSEGKLIVKSVVGPAVLDRFLATTMTYEAKDGGKAVKVSVVILPKGDWSDLPLPRIGLRLELDTVALQKVEWFGLGPDESYPDTANGARMALHQKTLDQLQTPYVRPQENGNRSRVEWLDFTNDKGMGIRVEGAPFFSFTARPWSSQQLHQARHLTDLEAGQTTSLNIDHFVSGVGSASCGPGVLEPYRLILTEGEPVTFAFTLRTL